MKIDPPRYWFAEGGFENTPHPCICVDDAQGGDPIILATLRRVNRPDELHDLCNAANRHREGRS